MMDDVMAPEVFQDEEMLALTASKYLTFSLGEEECGINIQNITEIIGLQKITEMPDAPPYVRGVINLRGKVIPIIDMRLRFGVAEREYDDRTCIIVVMVDNISVGLVVDTVAEVLDIQPGNIDPPPRIVHEGSHNFIEGLGRVEKDVIILLDIQKVLYDVDLEALA